MKRILACVIGLSMLVPYGISFAEGGIAPTSTEEATVTCNIADKATGVKNYSDGTGTSINLIEFTFSEAMNKETLTTSAIVIKDSKNAVVSYTPYEVTENSYKIDPKYLSKLSTANDNKLQTLPTPETYTITLSGVKSADGDEIDKTISFTTELILPLSYKNGKCIIDASKGKKLTAFHGDAINSGAASVWEGYATDRKPTTAIGAKVYDTDLTQAAPGRDITVATYVVDLGRKTNIAGMMWYAPSGVSYQGRRMQIGASNAVPDYTDVGKNKITNLDLTLFIKPYGNSYVNYPNCQTYFNDNMANEYQYIYGEMTQAQDHYQVAELFVWTYEPEMVESTIPADKAQNVSNAGSDAIENITINFYHKMKPETLNTTNITITDSKGNNVEYGKNADYPIEATEDMYSFSIQDLKKEETYTVTVGAGAERADGTKGKTYSFSFTTGSIAREPIAASEFILKVEPTGEGVNNTDCEDIEIYFARALDESTVVRSNFVITDAAGKEVSYKDEQFIYDKTNNCVTIPMEILNSGTEYTVTLSGLITAEDNGMEGNYAFSFTTGTISGEYNLLDLITVTPIIIPGSKITNLGSDGFITIDFARPMDTSSFVDGIEIVSAEGEKVDISKAEITPTRFKFDICNLDSNTSYTFSIKMKKEGQAGLALAEPTSNLIGTDYSGNFETTVIVDIPSVEGTQIINVALGKTISCATVSGGSIGSINDGDIATSVVTKAPSYIDLGGVYNVVAIGFTASDYSGSSPWHTAGFSLYNRYEEFADGDDPADMEKNYNYIATNATALGNSETAIFEVSEDFVATRYVGLMYKSPETVVAELSVYARVTTHFGDLAVTKSGTKYTVTAPITENVNAKTESYFVVWSEFDSLGNFLRVKADTVTAVGNATSRPTVDFTASQDAAKAQVYVAKNLNEFLVPAAPVEISLN